MSQFLETLIRPHILTLTPYSSARDEYCGKEGIFLDANENPYNSVLGKPFNRYPDPYQWEVKQKLSKIKGIKPESIFIGNGSDEAIDLLIKATCEPKINNIVIMPPTYGMYKVCADIQQVEVKVANLTENFEIDLTTVKNTVDSQTKVIWICSPNNPSGNSLKEEAILDIIKSYPKVLVVVDEAYIDFASQSSMISRIEEFENLAVIQTFSKAWGMAGLRLGTAYARSELLQILNKIKYPYNLNQVTQQLLFEALDKVEQKNEYVAQINAEREILKAELQKLEIITKIYPSDSNQLLVKFIDAKAVFHYLLDKKIILRDRSNVVLCDNCIRISIGTKEENQTLLKELLNYN